MLENTPPGAAVPAPFRWVKGKPRCMANHYASLIPCLKRVMEQIMEYNILDFSEWKDNSKFDSMFRKLIDGLELFYKG